MSSAVAASDQAPISVGLVTSGCGPESAARASRRSSSIDSPRRAGASAPWASIRRSPGVAAPLAARTRMGVEVAGRARGVVESDRGASGAERHGELVAGSRRRGGHAVGRCRRGGGVARVAQSGQAEVEDRARLRVRAVDQRHPDLERDPCALARAGCRLDRLAARSAAPSSRARASASASSVSSAPRSSSRSSAATACRR